MSKILNKSAWFCCVALAISLPGYLSADPLVFNNDSFKEARAHWEVRKAKLRLVFYNRKLTPSEDSFIQTEKTLTGGPGSKTENPEINRAVVAIVSLKFDPDLKSFHPSLLRGLNITLQKAFPGVVNDGVAVSGPADFAQRHTSNLSGEPRKGGTVDFTSSGISESSTRPGASFPGVSWNVSVRAPIVILWE